MPKPETTGPAGASDQTKHCPYCAEVIKAAAIKCRYCHSDLTGTEPEPVGVDARAGSAPEIVPPEREASPAAAASTGSSSEPRAIRRARTEEKRREDAASPLGSLGARLFRAGWVAVAALAVMLVATVVLAVMATRDWLDASELEDARAARTTAQAAVSQKVEALLSYDHATFDDDLEAAQEVMTPSFREEYEPTVESIRERAVSERQSQEATVVAAAALPSDDPDRVELLLFVDTISVREGSETQRVLQNRVKVTMVRDDGTWLVDDLTVPQS